MPAQYRYALDCEARLLAIEELTPGDRHSRAPFECVGCGRELLAKLGPILTHHFAHRAPEVCHGETYRHKLAKRVFFETYARCLAERLPYRLSLVRPRTCNRFENVLGSTCRIPRVEEILDLTRHFDRVEVEREWGGFRADVLLHSSTTNEVLFVEFAVTHLSSAVKRASGFRILEVRIDSEEDVAELGRAAIDGASERVRQFNFVDPRPSDWCRGACQARLDVFLVHPDGRCELSEAAAGAVISGSLSSRVLQTEVVRQAPRDYGEEVELFKQKVRAAAFDRVPVRDCYVCRYHGINTAFGVGPIYCKRLRKPCDSSEAVTCRFYRCFTSMAACREADARNVEYVEAREQKREEKARQWAEARAVKSRRRASRSQSQQVKDFLEQEAEWKRMRARSSAPAPESGAAEADAGAGEAPPYEVELQQEFPL